VNSLEIQDTKKLIKRLHLLTSDLAGLLNSQLKWMENYGPNYIPKNGTMTIEEYKISHDKVCTSYVVAIERCRANIRDLKKVLDARGHIPNKAERRKIRQDAAKYGERKE
jgi:hypothetical protein